MREKPKQIDYSISTFVYFLSGKSFKVCPPPLSQTQTSESFIVCDLIQREYFFIHYHI